MGSNFSRHQKIKKEPETYGLRSFKTLLPAKELSTFEFKLIELVKSINL